MRGNAGNPDPFQARQAQKEAQRVDAIEDLEAALALLRLCVAKNQAILQRESVLDESVFRASHASAQLANAVGKLVDAIEVEGRITILEQRFSVGKGRRGATQGQVRAIK